MMSECEEPEREREEREQQQQLHQLLQPKLLILQAGNNRGGRGRVCDCGRSSKGGAKSVEVAAQDVKTTTATAAAALAATQQ